MMGVAVPARIGGGVGEAEVGGEIDHLHVRRQGEKLFDHLLGGRMGQRAEHEVEAERRPVEAIERDELGQRVGRELGKHVAHLLPRLAVRGEERDLDPRMTQQQAHAFRSGIAGSAEHADLRQSGHVLILSAAGAAGKTGYRVEFREETRRAIRGRR